MARIRRGRRKKKSSSRVGGLGSKASSRSRVGSLGSKARSRSRTRRKSSGSTYRPRRTRVRRPRYRRPMGYRYPRRYRARPCSSGGCFVVFIILAIFFLIYLAPEIIFNLNLNATLALVLPIAVVGLLFIITIGFIANLVDDDDDGGGGSGGQVKVVERETILVVCPYCGAKNEQGITTCKNCDAEI